MQNNDIARPTWRSFPSEVKTFRTELPHRVLSQIEGKEPYNYNSAETGAMRRYGLRRGQRIPSNKIAIARLQKK